MKNKIKRVGLILSSLFIILGARVVFSEPGTEGDPLVTISYVEKKIDQVREQIKFYVDSKVSGETGGGNVLEVVNLSSGQSIIGKSGTEIILRGGSATAIASNLGGLSDLTSGEDIIMNGKISPNHLLLIPRDDGRGAYSTTDTIFLVRGEYEIR